MKAIPLYDLSWKEYDKGEGGTYSVAVEREAALSLFAALEAAGEFYDVKMSRSKTSLFVADPEAAVIPA